MQPKPIRVLLVDDSPLALAVLRQMLVTSPDLEVVGAATGGLEALEMIPALQPTVICADYHMRGMNGLEFTRQVMARFPRPILVVSSAVGANDTDRVFALLEAGAVDVFPKPRGGRDTDAQSAELFVKKVKIVAGVWVRGRLPRETVPATRSARPALPPPIPPTRAMQIVVMGASTGGPQALQTILSQLPRRFPLPILCVQHISSGFLGGLVSWLGAHFAGKVQIARIGEIPAPGHVYFPPENSHLVIDRGGRLQASSAPAYEGHRPSVNVTFLSAAAHYGDAAIGVLLTGMGRDGGDGMAALAQAGAWTIAQDEASCVIFGMPGDAVERGAARAVLPLTEIARALIAAAELAPHAFGEKNPYGNQ